MPFLLWVLAVAFIVAGLAGVVVPLIPGPPLVFIGLVLAAWADNFQHVGWVTLVILGLLTLVSPLVDFIATIMGAKRVGASRLAIAGAALGAVIGFLFGLPGLLLGPFVGAVAGEYLAERNVRQAGRAGLGTWLGILFGMAMKLALIFAMVGIFLAAYII
jgi:hypothetical protein